MIQYVKDNRRKADECIIKINECISKARACLDKYELSNDSLQDTQHGIKSERTSKLMRWLTRSKSTVKRG